MNGLTGVKVLLCVVFALAVLTNEAVASLGGGVGGGRSLGGGVGGGRSLGGGVGGGRSLGGGVGGGRSLGGGVGGEDKSTASKFLLNKGRIVPEYGSSQVVAGFK
uniref:Putative conserved secreted protein n=1 Tax=Rhipicephalus microplus TaxID=6941 RepID=A0A6G5A7T2_RHIMP